MNSIADQLYQFVDYILIAFRTELFIVLYAFIFLIVCYYFLYPFVQLFIAWEWKTFLAFFISIIFMLLVFQNIFSIQETKILLIAIIVFSFFIGGKKGIQWFKYQRKKKRLKSMSYRKRAH
ncbi:hypothetical protein J416_07162 [Gracilibacillus halophilus YIM-C55.5]|uniref:Uncharacterized protein n=1 Tax=Gracilibacillus halophilus YIM-C55.5 TaxID=1308866 RepID=N4WS31_9BACI|nr:hypothetical protein [Gracilibacillus halophilus]ENH97200.1 hypothetical protein J416_07162 [Gracilibacillus halophilus YIM-C55.5]